MSTGCACRHTTVALHAGHCCFRDDNHGRTTNIDEYQAGGLLPCGHTINGAEQP